jgi:chromosome segregation ATPase
MTTLQEQMKQRMAERPDATTLAWIDDRFEQVNKGYRGLTHACNVLIAEVEDHTDFVKSLQGQVNSLAEGLHEAQAAIGLLQAEVVELQGLMQKAREAYAAMRKETKQ